MLTWNVVDVIARSSQQNAASVTYRRAPITMADVWRTGDDVERGGKLVKKQVARGTAILSPPVVDRADLSVGLRCGGNWQAHRRWRNSSRIAEAGRTRPASAEAHAVDSAACSARRSSSVKSSPSSSATRSMTVPSGNVVGSSRMRRPFSTRARRGLMRLLYGDRRRPASAQSGGRNASICLSQEAIWFQMAGGRDATSRSNPETWVIAYSGDKQATESGLWSNVARGRRPSVHGVRGKSC